MKIRLLILSLLVSVPAFAWQPQTGDPFRLQPHRYAGDA
ncbi:hypothetical protein L403_04223 [Escherichia coli BWH 32]|nr:hypothetical protein L403_04223 [Escherichia coli BWH 32]